MEETMKRIGHYHLECFKDDTLKEKLWEMDIDNKIVNQGLDYSNNVTLYSTAKLTTAWYIGLVKTNTVAAAAMTYAVPTYTESTAIAARVVCTFAASSGQSITNSAAPSSFTNTGTSETIYGVCLVGANAAGVTTPGDTAAAGGVLFSYGLNGTGAQAWNTSNVILVTYTASDSSST
jgi:hypothetical protein